MKPIEIFEDITNIITRDYAGAEELLYPELHQLFLNVCAQLAENFGFEDEHLFDYVQLYLQAIGDPQLRFHIQEHAGFHRFSRGFSARSDGKDLYITTACQETQVRPGDKIVTISYQAPEIFRSRTLNLPEGMPPISERDGWDALLNHARVIEVQRGDAGLERVILEPYPPEPFVSEFTCRSIGADAVYLKIPSSHGDEALIELLKANHALVTQCSRLILDLRQNTGESRDALLPLLPYVCDRDMPVREFFQDGAVYTRHSARNDELTRAQIEPFAHAEDAQVSAMAGQLLAELAAKRGQGFLLEVEVEEDESIQSCRSAERVILLTDSSTENEAEWFVLGCKRQAGVTTLGRPTRGSLGYRNLVTVDYGFGRSFTYPISKMKWSFAGEGRHRTGVPVDVYIPWSKEEIWEDILLKQALIIK